ncbi:N1R/p28-like protein [Adoxophyes honmai entomopoxvirus 'L']|uniref:N1R/p28-like protein n=1 Tax=Adoxophyes honmai entomopoxvirus 'L' TaxID=1293540 RepID=A0A916KP49_9POXV|nr:N1R/p28-like protein [Adoxophyes honmai entomopoxvirus 'L']CCU55444.1 N1R/p28-like protein [Adoxophyes honmai entomopoxvirus 'L']
MNVNYDLKYMSEILDINYDYLFKKFNKDVVTEDELSYILNKKRFNNNDRVQEFNIALKYNIKPLMNIFEFMNENNLILSDNKYFLDIWIPLKDKKEILITDNLLEFMGFINDDILRGKDCHAIIRDKRRRYLNFLKENNIDYEEINYINKKSKNYEYIENEIKQILPQNLSRKKWIILNIDEFKESIMLLNNSKSKEVRTYYIRLEKIFYSYIEYTKDYYINLERCKSLYKEDINNNMLKQLEDSKNKEILQLKLEKEKAERRSLRLKDKFIEEKKLKSEQTIYISTSKSYSAQNRYKVGGVDNNNLLKHRLSTYNARSAEGDEWYYTFIKNINNYKQFESRFWSVLNSFRDKKDKEIIILYYNDLLEIFNFIADNYDKDINYFNDKVRIFIDNIDNDKFYIPEPFNVELVNICSIKNGKVDNKLIIASKEIIVKEIKDYFKTKIESNELEIKRKDVNDFIDKKYKYNKRDLWTLTKEVKSIFNNIILKY